jgi:hypothetical protein
VEIGPQMTEPPRGESPGEKAQYYASLAVMAARLFLKLELSKTEQAAVATLVGTFLRVQKSHNFDDFLAVLNRIKGMMPK